MKQFIYSVTFLLLCTSAAQAQQFIDKASVEFEVKTSLKKSMSNDRWGEMLKDNLPEFKTAFFNYSFADNKSLYKFDHWDEKSKLPEWMRNSDEENNWYMDFTAGKLYKQKSIAGSKFNIEDSIPEIKWRITNESRQILGFNCRKAVGKIFDSVYVFAFYTDEILIPGGPVSISGLPGMILGLTIPRMYASYIATKVVVNGINVADIKPSTAKKPYTFATYKSFIDEKAKDWYDWGDDKEENNRQKSLELWNIFL
ncbi:MAG: GLPGLI family protein [Bacteroidetes bacterium]|nr:GLPGLI family protein [Bacteroidota bacterium]